MPRKFEYFDRSRRPKLEYPKMTGEYVDYEVSQKIKKTGDGPEDFEVYDEVKEVKTNIKEFINSFAKDVGVENVLKRVAQTGDASLLNQREAVFMDTTIIPEDPGEAFAAANRVQQAYSKIDKGLTGGQTMEDFIKNLTPESLEKFINTKVEAIMAKKGAQDENSK